VGRVCSKSETTQVCVAHPAPTALLTLPRSIIDCTGDGVDVNQIGRQPPLSPNKAATHFPRLREATSIGYDEMLFFDDCNWGDHCGMVQAACKEANGKGVVTLRTPRGLGVAEFREGMAAFSAARPRGAADSR